METLSQAQSSNRRPWRTVTSRHVAWLVLSLPLAAYALVFPVKARLDKGETESHTGATIWHKMAESLPDVSAPTLFQAAFWMGALVFSVGALWLIWLALEGIGSAPPPSLEQTASESNDATQGLAIDDQA